MDRRNFLRNLIGGVAAGAAVRTFPFRVYSFPAEIKTLRRIFDPHISPGRIDFLDMKYWGGLPEALDTSLLTLRSSDRMGSPKLVEVPMIWQGGFEVTVS